MGNLRVLCNRLRGNLIGILFISSEQLGIFWVGINFCDLFKNFHVIVWPWNLLTWNFLKQNFFDKNILTHLYQTIGTYAYPEIAINCY